MKCRKISLTIEMFLSILEHLASYHFDLTFGRLTKPDPKGRSFGLEEDLFHEVVE